MDKLFRIKVYPFSFMIFMIFSNTYCQNQPENHENPDLISEIIRLRIDHTEGKLELAELFDLASFYLSIELYGKSAEIYGLYIDKSDKKMNSEDIVLKRAEARYNRALALFTQKNYRSSSEEFEQAYLENVSLNDALRMAGSASFLDKDIDMTIYYWEKYLNETQELSPERAAVENALTIVKSTDFSSKSVETKEASDSNSQNSLWEFLNPSTLPNPDAQFEKKRLI